MRTPNASSLPELDRLTRRGFNVRAIRITTTDGRDWSIEAADQGARLFEINTNGAEEFEEHDAVDGDAWEVGDMLDYLEAITAKQNRNA